MRLNSTICWISLGMFLSMAGGGCSLDVPEGQNPVGYLIRKALPEDKPSKQKRLLENLGSSDPDLRREAILILRDSKAENSKATSEILAILARGDSSEQVRAEAVKTIALREPDETAMKVFKETAKDSAKLVRGESVLAVAQRNNPESMEILLDRLANDPDPEIRSEAAAGLHAYRDRKVFRVLLTGMQDSHFSVSYQCKQSLETLTGQKFAYNIRLWQDWITNTPDPFAPLVSNKK